MTDVSTSSYWIHPDAIHIERNANGDPSKIMGNAVSGAVIICYIKDVEGLGYDEAHNYRRWRLSLTPTHFPTATEKYVYAAIPRPDNPEETAYIVFPSEKLDLYGKNEGGQQIGSELYYYVWLRGLLTATNAGGTLEREWAQQIDFGSLSSDEAINAGGDDTWWRYSAVDDTVTFLKQIVMDAKSWFANIRLGSDKRQLTGVAVSATAYTDSDTMVATPGYVEAHFLSSDRDDEAEGMIGFLQGLWVKARGLFGFDADGNLSANNASVAGNLTVTGKESVSTVHSPDYTGDTIADTGWNITNDYEGKSKLTVDYIYARIKLVAEALELKKYEVSAGDQIYSSAANDISRTDYLDENGEVLGYSIVTSPFLLRGLMMILRHTPLAGIMARRRKVRNTLTQAQLLQVRTVRCYFLAEDDERQVENWWRVGDLARCQTMNLVSSSRNDYTGTERKVGNVFWWRKVINVSANDGNVTYAYADNDGNKITTEEYEALPSPSKAAYHQIRTYNGTKKTEVNPDTQENYGGTVEIDGKTYHYIDIAYNYALEHAGAGGAATEWEGAALESDIPAAGDTMVQFGNSFDADRMNVMTFEINGLANMDAPCIKIYRGIYKYSLTQSWWGGQAMKMKLSPATGYVFYGPSFKFIQEYGVSRVPVDRGYWNEIPTERDDYGSHGQVRKCYYNDRVSHIGSLWLCIASSIDGKAHWVDSSGNYLTDAQYNALTTEQKALCSRKPDYVTIEPGESAEQQTIWQKQVSAGAAGDKGPFKSRVFCRSNTTPDTPTDVVPHGTTYNTYDNPVPPPVTGQPVWTDGIPQGVAILWSSVCTFYANGANSGWSTPAPETDTADLDIEFSPSTSQPAAPQGNTPFSDHTSEGWYDPSNLPAGQTMIWRAERKVKNGEYDGAWVITRIYGEKGDPGSPGTSGTSVVLRGEARTTNTIDPNYRTNYFADGDTVLLTDRTGHGSYAIDVYNEADEEWQESRLAVGSCYICEADGHLYYWNGTTWQDNGKITGTNGINGKDGWTVTANPSPVILTQATKPSSGSSYNNTTDFGLPLDVSFSALCGDTSATVGTPVVVSAGNMGLGISSSAGKITLDTYSPVGSAYVSRGVISLLVPVTYGTRSVSVPVNISVGVNLMGTFRTEIEGDVETSVAQKIQYGYDHYTDSGLTQLQLVGKYIRSSQVNISSLQTRVTGVESNVSDLGSEVAGVQTDVSTVKQTSDAIQLAVQNGWRNYVINPYASEGTVGSVQGRLVIKIPSPGDGGLNKGFVRFKTSGAWSINMTIFASTESGVDYGYIGDLGQTDPLPSGQWAAKVSGISSQSVTFDGSVSGSDFFAVAYKKDSSDDDYGDYIVVVINSYSGVTFDFSEVRQWMRDSRFGDVRGLYDTRGSDWQLTHSTDVTRNELKGQTVTWFCVVRCLSWNDGTQSLNFGTANTTPQIYAIKMSATNSVITVTTQMSGYENVSYGQTALGNEWYLCWVTAKLPDGVTITRAGFNNMIGIWQIAYAGVVKGAGTPTIDMIMQGAGIKSAGIDIGQGIVKLYGDRVVFADAQGGNTDKIWIDPASGTLHGVNAVFSGSLMYHKVVMLYGTDSTDPYRLAGRDHSGLGADIILNRYSRSQSGLLYINFPPAYLFPGAMIKIIDTTPSQSYVGVYLNIERISGEEAEVEESGSGNRAVNNFYDSFGVQSYDNMLTNVNFLTSNWSKITLVSTPNPLGLYSQYYVWNIIEAYN